MGECFSRTERRSAFVFNTENRCLWAHLAARMEYSAKDTLTDSTLSRISQRGVLTRSEIYANAEICHGEFFWRGPQFPRLKDGMPFLHGGDQNATIAAKSLERSPIRPEVNTRHPQWGARWKLVAISSLRESRQLREFGIQYPRTKEQAGELGPGALLEWDLETNPPPRGDHHQISTLSQSTFWGVANSIQIPGAPVSEHRWCIIAENWINGSIGPTGRKYGRRVALFPCAEEAA